VTKQNKMTGAVELDWFLTEILPKWLTVKSSEVKLFNL